MSDALLNSLIIEYLHSTIRIAVLIVLPCLGEVFLERSGVINIGMEGAILTGAFFGVLGSAITGSALVGVVFAVIAGAIVTLMFSVVVVTMRANQIVSGMAVNMVALGLTSFLNRLIFGVRGIPLMVAGIDPFPIPYLSNIPVIGRILFQQDVFVYLAYVLVPMAVFVMYRTTWGLKIRAVGEHPEAADTVGINVYAWRYRMAVLNGIMCGLAGAALSLSQLNTFTENMTAGRGFIAMAAVIFGRWNPASATLAALAFAATDALQLRVQGFGIGISSQFLMMMPYLFTLIAVAFFRGRWSMPAALASSYARESD
jgi:ABC-type uncharacterized transport system permease subunit